MAISLPKPPVEISSLKASLASRQLWSCFQPGQYSWRAARHCDHVDIQLYRQGCGPTVDRAYQLGVAGRRDTAIAVYHDGSSEGDRLLSCFRRVPGVNYVGGRAYLIVAGQAGDRGDRQSPLRVQVEEPGALAQADHPTLVADVVMAPHQLSFKDGKAHGCG
jgi:hypothetical protein